MGEADTAVREPVCAKIAGGEMNERLPPMSAVRTLPELMTSNVALAMLFARWSRLSAARVRPRPERAVRAQQRVAARVAKG